MKNFNNVAETYVVGNDYAADRSLGFKNDIQVALESHVGNGANLITDFREILSSIEGRQELQNIVMESVTNDSQFTDANVQNSPFYSNYSERCNLLMENSLYTTAMEAAMTDYSPIVSYVPYFLKKQWVECIFKDVLMTEVPSSPIINIPFERNYIEVDGKKYQVPDVYYDDALMAKIHAGTTGQKMKVTPIAMTTLAKGVSVLSDTYFDNFVAGPTKELAHNVRIVELDLKFKGDPGDSDFITGKLSVNIKVNPGTKLFEAGSISFTGENAAGTSYTVNPQIMGKVDFETGVITVYDAAGVVDAVVFDASLANRFNERSGEVKREVDKIQEVMPESGPRFNSAITLEEAADALVLQNIEMISYNADKMGEALANIEDYEIRTFLKNSYDRQEINGGSDYITNGLTEKPTVKGGFDGMGYTGYNGTLARYQEDLRLYWNRMINQLATKLKNPNVVIVAVCNPTLVDFLNGDDVKWVFDEASVAGVKIQYNFAVTNQGGRRVHIITSNLLQADGVRFIVIPTTKDLMTYKHYKYNVTIDRGYRHATKSLVPNVMCTQRTLTFEVMPVQGWMEIEGMSLTSPTTSLRG